ncbi:SDR family oxidoreductase [Aromatoleum toluvorans]|uniref:SDR family oxidoreductase n=1 Tax=Aromatoleum toluvorans TaxID=92002 RepID=A0ABX1Q6M2_9RHOO|nr:SDR family oxidoreductase [Aromatoleum toluvorans]NMG46377.1 SDR family oxidoreductase [Aromatoleum toluvorans]
MARTALIIGASRGLGLGLVRHFHQRDWQVVATCRDDRGAAALAAIDGVRVERVDICDRASREALAGRLDGNAFDLVFVNAGISGPEHRDVAPATLEEAGTLFMTNAIAPLQMAEQLLPRLKPDGVLGFMSSIMGSAALAQPQHRLYGASKAALNHLVCSLAAGLGESGPTVLCLHPGWVQTDMGGTAAPLDIETSTRGVCRVLESASGKGGVHFLDFQGQALPW